jgi:hypothetical protein
VSLFQFKYSGAESLTTSFFLMVLVSWTLLLL